MDLLKLIIQIIALTLSSLAAIMSIPLFLRLRWPAAPLWIIKLFASALSPLYFLIGVFGIITGLVTGSVFIGVIGIYNTLVFLIHIIRVNHQPILSESFIKKFGSKWKHYSSIRLLNVLDQLYHSTFILQDGLADPVINKDLIFANIPEGNQKLLCDLWQPSTKIKPSGLALIYLHGSAWYMLDKDLGTRPFFKLLTEQGHVVMDVAYRLAPETDMAGMVHDVKRAIHWMKENAAGLHVDPEKIVLAGGSAGGHLALLTAYTANDILFSPKELVGKNLGVQAVVSLYGVADLKACYYHLNQHLSTRIVPGQEKLKVPTQLPAWVKEKMGKEYYRLHFDKDFASSGALAPLLGGHPDECPEIYDQFSPICHVHHDCPPTLLIHGEDDLMAPLKSIRNLYARLQEEKIPVVIQLLPQTDHAFDLIMPKISPSAKAALLNVTMFLNVMASERELVGMQASLEGYES